jgi:DNA gyrase subunit A
MAVDGIRIAGRSTQGVTLFRLDDGEAVVSVARVPEEEQADEDDGGEEAELSSDGESAGDE